MINDIMSIMPIRVWLFWIIFLQAVIIFLGIKAYRQLLTDNRALAGFCEALLNIIGGKGKDVGTI